MAEERINEQEDRFEKIVQKNCFYQGDKKKIKKHRKAIQKTNKIECYKHLIGFQEESREIMAESQYLKK